MNSDKKSRKTKSKKEDGAFPSKNIKHDPQAESARAVFGKDSGAQKWFKVKNNVWHKRFNPLNCNYGLMD